MINVKGTTVYNKGKKIKTFEDEEDAESFKNALSMMGEKKIIKENNVQRLYTSINEFKHNLLNEGNEFNYMLLSRLKSDCEYFLGYGNGSERVLWADTVDEHIDKMKELWNGLEEKPEWLSFEDIEEYESKMKSMLQNNLNESNEYNRRGNEYIFSPVQMVKLVYEYPDYKRKNTLGFHGVEEVFAEENIETSSIENMFLELSDEGKEKVINFLKIDEFIQDYMFEVNSTKYL